MVCHWYFCADSLLCGRHLWGILLHRQQNEILQKNRLWIWVPSWQSQILFSHLFRVIFGRFQRRSLRFGEQHNHDLHTGLSGSWAYRHQRHCGLPGYLCSSSFSLLSFSKGHHSSERSWLFLFGNFHRWWSFILHRWLLHRQVEQDQGKQDFDDNSWQFDGSECFIDGVEHHFRICQFRICLHDIDKQHMLTPDLLYLNAIQKWIKFISILLLLIMTMEDTLQHIPIWQLLIKEDWSSHIFNVFDIRFKQILLFHLGNCKNNE